MIDQKGLLSILDKCQSTALKLNRKYWFGVRQTDAQTDLANSVEVVLCLSDFMLHRLSERPCR